MSSLKSSAGVGASVGGVGGGLLTAAVGNIGIAAGGTALGLGLSGMIVTGAVIGGVVGGLIWLFTGSTPKE